LITLQNLGGIAPPLGLRVKDTSVASFEVLTRGLAMNLEGLETGIKLWQDAEAIRKLRATYCHLVDA